MVVTAWYGMEPAWVGWVISIVGALMITLSFCFRWLRMHSEEHALRFAFGPLGPFRNALRYDGIRSLRADRSRWIDGWGIHYGVGRGWIWNLWGFDCVALVLTDGMRLRLGTDDVEGLLSHLEARTGLQRETAEAAAEEPVA